MCACIVCVCLYVCACITHLSTCETSIGKHTHTHTQGREVSFHKSISRGGVFQELYLWGVCICEVSLSVMRCLSKSCICEATETHTPIVVTHTMQSSPCSRCSPKCLQLTCVVIGLQVSVGLTLCPNWYKATTAFIRSASCSHPALEVCSKPLE